MFGLEFVPVVLILLCTFCSHASTFKTLVITWICVSVCFFTVHVLPVADVLQVTRRLLPAQLGLLLVGLQPGVSVSAELGAGRHAAGGRTPHPSPLSTPEGGCCRCCASIIPNDANSTETSRSAQGRSARGAHPFSGSGSGAHGSCQSSESAESRLLSRRMNISHFHCSDRIYVP